MAGLQTERPDRRKKKRIQLTRAIIARYGAVGVIVLDISDGGARIEHFTKLDVGKRARLRFDWNDRAIEVEGRAVSCRVHRFSQGNGGATVFQSSLHFVQYIGDAQAALKDMVATYVARSLAEQVANARGIGPVTERNMPVFRSGVVAASGLAGEKGKRLIPDADIVLDRGYIRCTWVNHRRWEKKWTRVSSQPDEGFTVLASEPPDHIERLCETYQSAPPDERRLIQLMARMSLDALAQTPEPSPSS
jgi:PilZ domain-containing protein